VYLIFAILVLHRAFFVGFHHIFLSFPDARPRGRRRAAERRAPMLGERAEPNYKKTFARSKFMKKALTFFASATIIVCVISC